MVAEETRLLILFPRYLYECKMSLVRRDVIRRMLIYPNTRLSGQGWNDYDTEKSVGENAANILPGCQAVFAYKPLGGKNFPTLKGLDSLHVPLILSYNEMWDVEWTTKEIRESHCKLAICHHENDLSKYEDVHGCKFVHIPHCAEPVLFLKHEKPWFERDIEFLLTGVLSPEIYPLRQRFANLIRSGKLDGTIRNHPGYRLRSMEDCDRQAEEYAALLGRTKISLCCTSKYHYALAKQFESAMAGCCVVSDIPDQRGMAKIIFPVSPKESDESLLYSLKKASEQAEKLGSMAQLAVLERHTTGCYVEQLLSYVAELL